jgi:hypothetical protein
MRNKYGELPSERNVHNAQPLQILPFSTSFDPPLEMGQHGKIMNAQNVARTGIHNSPEPTAIPIAAVRHSPHGWSNLDFLLFGRLRMVPAPMNPIPVAIP